MCNDSELTRVRREHQLTTEEYSLQGYTVPETPPQPSQEEKENNDKDHERIEVVPPPPHGSSPSLDTPLVSKSSVINLDSSGTVCEESRSVGNDGDDIFKSSIDIKEGDLQNVYSEDPLLAETGEVVPGTSFDAEGENSMTAGQGRDDVESNSCEEEEASRVEVKGEPEEEEQEDKARWVESLNY